MSEQLRKTIQVHYITIDGDNIYGIDMNGAVWYRKKIPGYTTSYTAPYNNSNKADAKKEEEILWKPLAMEARVSIGNNGPAKDIPPGPELEAVEVPVSPDTTTGEALVNATGETQATSEITKEEDENESYCC